MSDIDELLAAAADDTDRPLRYSVDDIVQRGRHSVRRRRIASVSTAVLTTAAIVSGAAAWSANRSESVGPVGTPTGQTITIDVKTGRVIDDETGKTVVPPPPVSPVSDAEILERCKQYDLEQVQFLKERHANVYDKAGPINAQWKVVLKAGERNMLDAVFLSPDRSIASTCTMDKPKYIRTNGRISTTEVMPRDESDQPQAISNGIRVPAGVTRVLVDQAGEISPREALMGADGFFTVGHPVAAEEPWRTTRIRGYDATGKKVFEQDRVREPSDNRQTAYVKVRAAELKMWPDGKGWPTDKNGPKPEKIPSAALLGQFEGKHATTALIDLDGRKTQRVTLDDFRAGRFDILIEGARQKVVPFRVRGLAQDGTGVYDQLADPSKTLR